MFQVNSIVRQVLRNCDISDSTYAGLYTVCGLALRLRELYKWEKGLSPWEERDAREVLDWIGFKEARWNELADKKLAVLSILEHTYDPFDTASVNAVLEGQDLFYGAGYGRSLKPTFFLAHIEDKRQIDGHAVYFLGSELARDLVAMPALNQDGCVILRKQSAWTFLWDHIFYIKKSGHFALEFGMEHCGLKNAGHKALQEGLESLFAVQEDTFIYHELGEMHDAVFDRHMWREIVAAYAHTPVELLARTVKDFLADTNEFGPLRHITRGKRSASLAFYVAFVDGLSKELFPELTAVFKDFVATSDWTIIERAVAKGYDDARAHAETIMSIYQSGQDSGDTDWVRDEIEKKLLGRIIH